MSKKARCSAAAVIVAIFLGILTTSSGISFADCSEIEITAVLLVNGIYPGSSLEIDLLHVFPVYQITNPTDEELLAAVENVYINDPFHDIYYHQRIATEGSYHLYLAQPTDFGAVTIIDWQTGEVVFAGTIVWMGMGCVVIPSSASHEAGITPGGPAANPTTMAAFPSIFWDGSSWGTPEQLTEDAVTYLKHTDLFHGFAECGDYHVVGYTHTPSVGMTDPYVAIQIILVRGYLPPPWGPVETEVPLETSWHLHRSYPNPFNPRTSVSFDVSSAQHISISVFDLAGKQISLLTDRVYPAGSYTLEWNGRDSPGRAVSSGTYLIRMEAEGRAESKKVMLVR